MKKRDRNKQPFKPHSRQLSLHRQALQHAIRFAPARIPPLVYMDEITQFTPEQLERLRLPEEKRRQLIEGEWLPFEEDADDRG